MSLPNRTRPLGSSALPLLVAALLAAGCSGTSDDAPGTFTTHRVMSFSVMGDSGLGAPEFLQVPSSANVPQLTRNIADLASLEPRPEVSFMTGDLVMNFAEDQGQELASQLQAWQALFSTLPGSGALDFVPSIGNHESCEYDTATGQQWPNPASYPVWQGWAASHGYDRYAGNGPTPAGQNPDLLLQDERNLSYSFTRGNVRFVVVNTDTLASPVDPATQKPYPGWVPIHWLESELVRAQADFAVDHIFVIGHRVLEAPPWAVDEDEGPVLDTPTYPLASRLITALKACSKVRAYLCGHIHCQDLRRLQGGTGPWQVITGSTGSPLDPGWTPEGGTYFGFRVVNLYSDGRVGLVSYRRPTPPAPQKYYEDAPVAPPAAVPDPEFFLR